MREKTQSALQGTPASPGVAKGNVRMIGHERDFVKFKRGEVLVARTTNPSFTPVMALACAIVTDIGSRLSHAAIVARELGIPAVVGAEGASKKLKDGDVVVIDGSKGVVDIVG